MKKKKKVFLLFLIVGLMGILVSIYSFTYAKYVSNSVWNYYLKSKGFYFNSDYLDTNNKKNVDNFWIGERVNFNIRNNLNDIVVTEYDINYKVTCTIKDDTTANCYLNGTNSNVYEGVLSNYEVCINNTNNGVDVSSFDKTTCEINNYKWENQIASQDLYFDIADLGELKDLTVNIKIESTSPYKKTLSGDFILNKVESFDERISINYQNYYKHDRLIVSNSYLKNKCVTIMWDAADLNIDIDSNEIISYEVDSNNYINQITVQIPSKRSLSYIFYKRSLNKNFDISSFSYQEENNC